MGATACGGGDDGGQGAKATVQPLPPAAELLPGLGDLGFQLVQQERDPASVGGLDAHRGIFQRESRPPAVLRVDVRVYPTSETATADFRTLAEALRRPPPEFVGAQVVNVDSPKLPLGDQAQGYVTDKPDRQGNSAWTDIVRFGRVVVISQVLIARESEARPVRAAVAERIQARLK